MDSMDRFIVIDNSGSEVARMTTLLRMAFPQAVVLPTLEDKQFRTFHDWDNVLTYLRELPDCPTIAVFDLALSQVEDYEDVVKGMVKCEYIHSIFPEWLFIAHSRYSSRAEGELMLAKVFDGFIDKGDLDSVQKNTEARALFVKTAILRANRRSLQPGELLPKHIKIVDSLGMRLTRAALGDAAISEIIYEESKGWSEGEVSSLTSGFSGAFILSLSGRGDQGIESLVVKVARQAITIEREIEVVNEYMTRLGPLDGHLVQLENKKHELAEGAGVYYRQTRVEGEPLLRRVMSGSWPSTRPYLAPVATLCIQVARRGVDGLASKAAEKAFGLSELDVSRLRTSLAECNLVAQGLRKRGLWPIHLPAQDIVAGAVLAAAEAWSANILAGVSLPSCVQHGDLNPSNVIAADDCSFRFIDLSRLGDWPIGYDLARLSLLLRTRNMSGHQNEDYFYDNFNRWLHDPVMAVDGDYDIDKAMCPESMHCDQLYATFVRSCDAALRPSLILSYQLGTIWDLIKIISYQDLSLLKRTWAVSACYSALERMIATKATAVNSSGQPLWGPH